MATRPFAARLRAARRRAGLTQVEVARLVGYDANTVARWERGERVPHPRTQSTALAALAALADSVEGGMSSRILVDRPMVV